MVVFQNHKKLTRQCRKVCRDLITVRVPDGGFHRLLHFCKTVILETCNTSEVLFDTDCTKTFKVTYTISVFVGIKKAN